MKLEPGVQAPEFSLQGADGNTYNLAGFRGRRLVLYFYPKDDTPGCTTEALDFTSLLRQFEQLNTVVVGVSPDSVEKHRKFIEKRELGILLLSDPEKKCIEAYGAWGEKMNYGRVYTGLIRSTLLIDAEGIVKKAYYNVKAKGHAERVLQDLSVL